MKPRILQSLVALTVTFLLAACGDDNNPASDGEPAVAIAFGVDAARGKGAGPQQAGLVLSGANGTLQLSELRMIVDEFELKRADVECDGAVDEDACEKFDAPPAFLSVPLDGSEAIVIDRPVPTGRYEELEFEVENLEVNEGDALRQQQAQALMAEIQAEYPDWPRKASILAIGAFTPTGGQARAFRVYLDAEIEVELEFAEPLVIDDGDPDRTVSITLAPRAWFTRADGTVLDLSDADYGLTGDLLELEVELHAGFTEIDWD